MAQKKAISGFSKLSATEKIRWIQNEHGLPTEHLKTIEQHLHPNQELQDIYAEFSENTISNFFIPFGLAPNFLINDKWYVLPMAIEESSVVAAASHAAKFWSAHGGFSATVVDTMKTGEVHLFWSGDSRFLEALFDKSRRKLTNAVAPETESMRKRGGGLINISLVDKTSELENHYKIHARFRTANAMGANFINTVLEKLAIKWKQLVEEAISREQVIGELEINMAILSNYTPDSLVKVSAETDVSHLGIFDSALSGEQFAEKFVRAVRIAREDTYRAVTHNKGIFNGMDGVIIATGNDFRAVEACGHAYAAKDGKYRGLSMARISNNLFSIKLEIPMSVGTVGGLTSGHPMAQTSLKLLGDPSAEELMMIVAAAGLANNFSAVRSLITGGIQKGHMKMHLPNILRQLNANELQRSAALEYFRDKTVSFDAVKKFISEYQ